MRGRLREFVTRLGALCVLCVASVVAQEGTPPPKSAAELCAEAEGLAEVGMPAAAIARYGEALQRDPEHVAALVGRGTARASLARYDEAEADFERASALAPDDAFIAEWHGHVLWLQDKDRRAFEVLQRAVALDPESASALDLLATVELELGLDEFALRHIDAAVALDPNVAEYHWTRGRILEARGRRDAADREYRIAQRLDPDYRAPDIDETALVFVQGFGPLLMFAIGLLGLLTFAGLLQASRARAELERVPRNHQPARYDGAVGDLFTLYLQNVVLTVITLGIYRFWAKVRIRRYRYQHTSFAGGRFDYHATGEEKFAGFAKGMLLLAPAIGALYLLYLVLLPSLGEDAAFNVCFWSFVLVMYGLRPLLLVGAQRFNLSRTSWNNLRFRFTGRVGPAYRVYAADLPRMILTLGLFWSWHQCNVRRFRLKHTRMGELGFGYRGRGGELFGITVGGTLLCYLTLGIYGPWQLARVQRFHIENTTFRGKAFRSRLTGSLVLARVVPAMLAIVLTLGLAIPWALHRWYELVANTTTYPEPIDPAEVRSIQDAAASPVVEGFGEAGDALAEIGDFFG